MKPRESGRQALDTERGNQPLEAQPCAWIGWPLPSGPIGLESGGISPQTRPPRSRGLSSGQSGEQQPDHLLEGLPNGMKNPVSSGGSCVGVRRLGRPSGTHQPGRADDVGCLAGVWGPVSGLPGQAQASPGRLEPVWRAVWGRGPAHQADSGGSLRGGVPRGRPVRSSVPRLSSLVPRPPSLVPRRSTV